MLSKNFKDLMESRNYRAKLCFKLWLALAGSKDGDSHCKTGV